MELRTEPHRTRDTWLRVALVATGIGLFVVALLQSLLLRPSHEVVLGIVLIIATVGAGLLARALRRGTSTVVALAVAAVVVVSELVWFISSWYPAWVIAQAGGFVVAFTVFTIAWVARRRRPLRGARLAGSIATRTVGGVLALVAGVLAVAVVTNSITPNPVTAALQSSFNAGNSFSPSGPANKKTVMGDGTLRTTDIRYGTEYPNSYLDVYIAKGSSTPDRPTVINVHGGGFIEGDKLTGDPNTGAGADGDKLTLDPFLNAGYNYVSINYALAPGEKYPVPTRQVVEALGFLQDHADTYGLDMDNVILTGGSAGGQIVGQVANIQTNPAYAKAIGIAPTLRTTPKAVLLDSPVLDMNRASSTQSPSVAADLLFGLAARTYLGTSQATLLEAGITNHVTKQFPPTFVSDGNTGTFPDQARDLHEKLDRLGVRNELDLYPKSEAVLGHGYMTNPSPQTDDYLQKKFAFLDKVLA